MYVLLSVAPASTFLHCLHAFGSDRKLDLILEAESDKQYYKVIINKWINKWKEQEGPNQ